MLSEPPHTAEPTSTPKLPLSWLSMEPRWMQTPPRLNLASVPFLWEEAPGKPRPSAASEVPWTTPALGELPPPPRLLKEGKQSTLASPTTVLDGPERGGEGSKRWGSFKMCKEVIGGGGNGRLRLGKRRPTPSFSVSSYTRSPFLVTIYESFKQVVPWRRRST